MEQILHEQHSTLIFLPHPQKLSAFNNVCVLFFLGSTEAVKLIFLKPKYRVGLHSLLAVLSLEAEAFPCLCTETIKKAEKGKYF